MVVAEVIGEIAMQGQRVAGTVVAAVVQEDAEQRARLIRNRHTALILHVREALFNEMCDRGA
jgi:hypothetical protein